MAMEYLDAVIGELDPIKVQRAVRSALPYIRAAYNSSWQLEGYMAEDARRGRYRRKKGEKNEKPFPTVPPPD
ncbi:MAG: hypothetical protein R3293_28195, partial [Candidatus Promineifilaceae bacterium]|nr:hypothetical protein [Candidatus Promineifilaceae bacterium]